MADIRPNVQRMADQADGSIVKVTWNDLVTGNNVGVPVQFVQHADRCVEVRGTFNAAIVTIEGSNGGTAYYPLTKPDGNQAVFNNSAGIAQILENPLFIRPNVSTAANNMNLTVDLILRRQFTR